MASSEWTQQAKCFSVLPQSHIASPSYSNLKFSAAQEAGIPAYASPMHALSGLMFFVRLQMLCVSALQKEQVASII
jgi:hypothetical protein